MPLDHASQNVQESFSDLRLKIQEKGLFKSGKNEILPVFCFDLVTYFLVLSLAFFYPFFAFFLAFPLVRLQYHFHDALHGQWGKVWPSFLKKITPALLLVTEHYWVHIEHGPHHRNVNQFAGSRKKDPDNFYHLVGLCQKYSPLPIQGTLFVALFFVLPRLYIETLFFTLKKPRIIEALSHILGGVFLSVFLGFSGILFLCLGYSVSMGLTQLVHHVPQECPGSLVWAQRQLENSQNVTDTPWIFYWMGGHNYQIEHHLFPTASRFALRRIAPEVKQWAKQMDLPYRELNFGEALDNFLEASKNSKHSPAS